MKIPFEARYIQVKWADKDTVDRIYESNDTIEIEEFDNDRYKLEAITYSKIDNNKSGQLAFYIIDNKSDYHPYFINAKNEKIELISVKDSDTGKIWWIENGKWNKKDLYRDSSLCRTAGEAKIVFGDFSCIIQIRSLSFTYDDLNLYLKDFRSDLWGLILKEDSYVLGEVKTKKEKSIKVELTERINQFIEFVEKILKNPKKELTREYRLQKANQVRPVKKTFIEVLTKGTSSKYLTGQGHVEKLNIAENKYIHSLIDRLSTILENEIKILDKRSKEFKNELINIERRINDLINFINTNSMKIDKVIIENEIRDLKEKNDRENSILKKALSNQINFCAFEQKNIFIQLGKQLHNYNFDFFGNVKNNLNDSWSSFRDEESKGTKLENSFYIFSFDKNIFNNKLQSDCEYEITGYIDAKNYYLCIDKNKKKHYIPTNSKNNTKCDEYGGFKFERQFKYISDIKKIDPYLNKLLKKKIDLEKSDWMEKLKQYDKEELKNEKKALLKSRDILVKDNNENTKKLSDLNYTLSKLRKNKKQFIKNKIRIQYFFPGSMTFTQNPNYFGAHKIYKQIINQSGLDEDLFKRLEILEKIGILDIPKVYERWCLLQIIKVLINKFHFMPQEEKWKEILTEQIFVKNPVNIELRFKNDDSEREILLTYEKELSNGKRPDFVLDVKGRISKSYRLIMDAKFIEEIKISDIINDLYNTKNYAEDRKNKVFILHPSKKSVPKKKTPQMWAENSYYGETNMFAWDNINPNHKYGAILLSPIQKQGMYLDDLKRLIGMFLQYGMEDNKNTRNRDGKIDPLPKEKMFCIVCGGTNHNKPNPMLAGKSKNSYKYWITCQDCNHMTIYSYCGNCKNRLIKNGSYWTYHATEALEPVNIKCPSCGDLL